MAERESTNSGGEDYQPVPPEEVKPLVIACYAAVVGQDKAEEMYRTREQRESKRRQEETRKNGAYFSRGIYADQPGGSESASVKAWRERQAARHEAIWAPREEQHHVD